MTREDKMKLVVTAIENMVSTHIVFVADPAVSQMNIARGVAEEARQVLLRALIQMMDGDDKSELERLRERNSDLVAKIARALMVLREHPTPNTEATLEAKALLSMALESANRSGWT